MHTPFAHRTRLLSLTCAAAALMLASPPLARSAQQGSSSTIDRTAADAIRDHIDQAEDAVDSLLKWQPVPTKVVRSEKDNTVPTAPATTLISVPRSDVEKVAALLDAVAVMLPPPSGAASRGDLRAHVEEAKEIVMEELLPPAAEPVGTSGTAQDLVTIDRSALKRLLVELDAMKEIVPSVLK